MTSESRAFENERKDCQLKRFLTNAALIQHAEATMSPDTADLVLYLITGVACVVWMIAFRCLWLLDHPKSSKVDDADDRYDVSQEAHSVATKEDEPLVPASSANLQVVGHFVELSLRLARQIAQKLPAAQITSQSPQSIVLEPIRFGQWIGFARIDISLTPLGEERTEISRSVWQQRSQAPKWAWWLSGIGLVAIIAGFTLIKTLVVNHPSPAVRWQTVQMVQVVHLLWPPFLAVAFAKAHKISGQTIAGLLDGMITNLPYVESISVPTPNR